MVLFARIYAKNPSNGFHACGGAILMAVEQAANGIWSDTKRRLSSSIYERLRNSQRKGGLGNANTMHGALTLFAAEGVMRRLDQANLLSEVVLKGARLWSVWGGDNTRATQDTDYTTQQPGLRGASPENAASYIERIIRALSTGIDDGLNMMTDSFRVATLDGKLGGCAIDGFAALHTARIPILLEIGFGHTLPDGAIVDTQWFPVVKGLGKPLDIKAYAPEMWLAEKLRIAFEYGVDNTRLKDFFDMRMLFAMRPDRALLTDCLKATCADFAVSMPSSLNDIPCLSLEYARQHDALWRNRRWPEWTGKPFSPGRDPSLVEAIADIREAIRHYRVLEPKPAVRVHIGSAPAFTSVTDRVVLPS